ncbi:MAG: Ig-like domain-containing protein [Planctomycetota bacterium]
MKTESLHRTGEDSRYARSGADLTCALGLALAALGVTGCGGGSTGGTPQTPGGVNTDNVEFFFNETNSGGTAQEVGLVAAYYGRFVQVFGLDSPLNSPTPPVRVPMSDGFVINPALVSIGGEYLIETNAVTGQDQLIILRDVTDESPNGGRAQFFDLLQQVESGLPTIRVADVGTVGVFTMVPRNATMVLVFDDLLDPNTIDATTIQLVSGYPPTNPFEARILVDVHHGALADLDGVPGDEFYPTRVIVDPTVSEIEAFQTNPPLPANSTGLPPSIDSNRANLLLSIPTLKNPAAGQQRVLQTPTGHALSAQANFPANLGLPTQPVLRAFRSGGRPDLFDIAQNPFNGFLQDNEAPKVVGSNPVTLPSAPQQVDGVRFLIPTLQFPSTLCAQTPEVGDVISQSGVFAEVILDSPTPVQNGVVNNIQVRLIQYPSTWTGPEEWEQFGLGDATYESAYDPADDLGRQACFVSVQPRPTGYPAEPVTGIDPFSTIRVRFSEAMDPSSLTAFDSLTLTRTAVPSTGIPSTDQFVIGRVGQTADLRDFTFQPDLPLNHIAGQAESYFVAIASGQFAPRDLAGNAVSVFEQVQLRVDPAANAQLNGGRVSRFVSIDEEFPIAASGETLLPEWGGQLLVDSGRQLIRPRPVVRSQIFIDREQPTLQGQTPFSNGIVTPLSNFGSKMQTLWRYADCGWSINDGTNLNLDVEGLGWSPAGGSIVADAFDEFEIRLAHSRWAPDEIIDAGSLFPLYPSSGLVQIFTNNLLANEPQVVVHPRELGYIINPADVVIAPSGTRIVPFPLNRSVPVEERRTYTWRDTSIRTRSGLQNGGVDPSYYLTALGLPVPTAPNKFYPPGEVQTAGLPLLLEFRTYRDDSALGINGFDINLAANSSSKPYFRAFSTGGIRQNGQPKFVDPDNETQANGGFNPGSTVPGAVTYGLDNSVYLGALDLVVRISRAHSVWFRSAIVGEPAFIGRNYLPPTLEPRAEDQPIGTSIDVEFRGATAIAYFATPPATPPPGIPGNSLAWIDNDSGDQNPNDPGSVGGAQPFTEYQMNAFTLDLYGDYYNEVDPPMNVHRTTNGNPGLTFLSGDSTWKTDVSAISGAQFYQVRLNFLANIATGEAPELSAFAISWTQ